MASKAASLAAKTFNRVPLPNNIAAIGRNYLSHINELGNARPTEPFFFLKAPSTVLHPENGPVQIPRNSNVHYEVELGVVVGKDMDNVHSIQIEGAEKRLAAVKSAEGKNRTISSYIGGWFVGIDMTARTYQDAAKSKGLPWTLAKNFKTFLPVSSLIPRTRLPYFAWDSSSIRLHLAVNGVERQNDSTSLMLFKIPELLQHVTSVMPLYRGDMLLTGTPKGVGEVKGGDKMAAWLSIDGNVVEESRIEVDCVWREDGYGAPPKGRIFRTRRVGAEKGEKKIEEPAPEDQPEEKKAEETKPDPQQALGNETSH